MPNIVCPKCLKSNAVIQQVYEEKSVMIHCPDCINYWISELQDVVYANKQASLITDEFSEEEEDEGEEYENDEFEELTDEEIIFQAAEDHANKEIAALLDVLLRDFWKYGLEAEDYYGIAKLKLLVSHRNKFSFDGYVFCTVKLGEASMRYKEIHYDGDGLRLSEGGFENFGSGPESYSADVYPLEELEDALNIMSSVEQFIEDFLDMLNNDGYLDIEDYIEDLEEK